MVFSVLNDTIINEKMPNLSKLQLNGLTEEIREVPRLNILFRGFKSGFNIK